MFQLHRTNTFLFVPIALLLLSFSLDLCCKVCASIVPHRTSEADSSVINKTSTISPLSATFYAETCPGLSGFMYTQTKYAIQRNRRKAAALLRLFFHDCFVQGCDASVLLNSTGGDVAEKDAGPNLSLAGFSTIDEIKAKVDKKCGAGVVSCADILAIAGRDAVRIVGGPYIPVRLGRRDGLSSSADQTSSLPKPSNLVTDTLASFTGVGLDMIDMITLSGAHTIGRAQCGTFSPRLTGVAHINTHYEEGLIKQCGADTPLPQTAPTKNTVFVANDHFTPFKFDNQYYKNLINGYGLFPSDDALALDSRTLAMVKKFSTSQTAFFSHFKKSMVKMSELSILTGSDGEIRNVCGRVN